MSIGGWLGRGWTMSEYTPFPVASLPSPLREYVREGAEALQCDPSYLALPILVTAASAIGNARRIRLTPTRSQPPVLWGGIVGDSGAGKSEPLKLATRPAWRRQRKLLNEHKAAMAAYKSDHSDWKKQAKEERGDEPDPPEPCQHPVCIDITVEALGARLEVTPHGVLVAPDELAGWFASFNQYKKGGADVPNWLSMYDASALKTDRKGGDRTTIYVPHAAVCVVGGIQPDTLRRCFTPEFFENGLAARLILTMPPRHKPVWSEADISQATRVAVDDLFERLYALRQDDGPDGPEPRMIDLAGDAKDEYVAWFHRHVGEVENLHGPEQATWMKGIGLPARLALIDHCVRGGDGLVDRQSVRNGIAMADWFTRETLRVYEALGGDDDPLAALMRWIERRGGRCTVREVYNNLSRYRGKAQQAEEDLQVLVDEGRGWWDHRGPGGGGGRPISVFILNSTNSTSTTNENQQKNRCSAGAGGDGETKNNGQASANGRVTF